MKPYTTTQDEARLSPVRILIVDDHPAVRKGLALLLEPEGIEVCAEAHSLVEALDRADEHKPDLALVDLSLGNDNGLTLLAEFVLRGLPSLVYSMHEDGRRVQSAFATGCLGYVSKCEPHEVLIAAIGEVAAHKRFVSPRAALALADLIAEGNINPVGELSIQESEVYRLLGAGESTRTIATSMNISRHTVETYYARIRQKLDIPDMADLRRHASKASRKSPL
jgi:DNA-binding NarL/FixJ family response regulator